MGTNKTDTSFEVVIPCENHKVNGTLILPSNAGSIVIFAHGSGSSRLSPRNQFVAKQLNEAGLATLLLDLLEEEESDDRDKIFDINLLADRLFCASKWLRTNHPTCDLIQGYFGASTGSGAALVAAARDPFAIKAIVSRGGRPDLAGDSLPKVTAPTLLIVGGNDESVLELNEQALRDLSCPKNLVIVPRATHLFEEPGALDQVANLARDWFIQYLTQSNHRRPS